MWSRAAPGARDLDPGGGVGSAESFIYEVGKEKEGRIHQGQWRVLSPRKSSTL